jgi:F-type H+-transporting ATPase subunit b
MAKYSSRRLREMDGKAKDSLAEASRPPRPTRCAAHSICPRRSARDQNALNETFSADIPPFETAPDLVSGIELTAERTKGGMEHRGLSRSLEKERRRTSERKAKPKPKPKPEPAPEAKAA